MNPPAKSEFENLKEIFWHQIINSKIPPDLQNNYRDTINVMKAGFEAGIRFCLENKKYLIT